MKLKDLLDTSITEFNYVNIEFISNKPFTYPRYTKIHRYYDTSLMPLEILDMNVIGWEIKRNAEISILEVTIFEN